MNTVWLMASSAPDRSTLCAPDEGSTHPEPIRRGLAQAVGSAREAMHPS